MYNNLINRFLICLFAILILASCQEERTNTLDTSLFGYEYFPLEVGRYWIFRVDSTIVDDKGAKIIESTAYIKEEITETFLNSLGETIYVVQRSWSNDRNGNYLITDAWSAEINEDHAVRNEENLRFIKMVFPIDKDIIWEGNQFDEQVNVDIAGEMIKIYKDWGDYRVVGEQVNTWSNGVRYENTVAISQADFESEIERRISNEYYAPNIGLIKKEMTIYDSQCVCPGESWEEKAESGYTLLQQLVEYN